MRALAERPGMILSRGQLEDRLYGWGEEIESNAVDVLIHYIRKRFHRDIIRNIRGAGWIDPERLTACRSAVPSSSYFRLC